MTHNVSGFIVGPMWNEFMQYALSTLPNVPFQRTTVDETGLKPVLRGIWQGGDSTIVDGTTGLPATPATPPQNLQERVTCDVHNILYWLNKDDPNGPDNGQNDPQYPYWEYPVDAWSATNGCVAGQPVIVGPAAPETLSPSATDTSTTPQTSEPLPQ
jgi:hypothetical protein